MLASTTLAASASKALVYAYFATQYDFLTVYYCARLAVLPARELRPRPK